MRPGVTGHIPYCPALPLVNDIHTTSPTSASYHYSHHDTLDVYSGHRKGNRTGVPLSSVLVFVHGGAWGSGSKFMYRLIGHRFDALGFVAVVVGYRKYPYGTADSQVCHLYCTT
jgi:acetyl esterase/lipase